MIRTREPKPTTRHTFGRGAIAAALVLSAAAGMPAADAETLDRALLKQAPTVIRHLKDRGYKNVGVLKFLVKKGDAPASDRVGTLNLDLAARLQVALVLANDSRQPVGIIRDASAVAATLPGANHLSRAGRLALFRAKYPLAWGHQRVEPDAFVTGVAMMSRDLREVTVSILAFDKSGDEKFMEFHMVVPKFTASTDVPTLVGAGESFRTRGLFDGGKVKVTAREVSETAARVKTAQEKNPLQDREAPVAMEVLYDGRPVPLEFRGGEANLREPQAGQRVTFVLRKTDRNRGRYGVVLMVNGENTLYRERLAPLLCHKWVLGPDSAIITVRGYQIDGQSAAAFEVLSREESREGEIDYGPDTGMLTLVIFREAEGEREPLPLDDEAEGVAAVSRGAPSGWTAEAETLAALKYELREGPHQGESRGLIVQGPATDAAIRPVAFRPAPTPVMAAAIIYYRPDAAAPRTAGSGGCP